MGAEPFDAVLSAAQAGAEWAVAELYRAHDPKLARYLRAQVGQDAADLAGDTWLSVARNLPSFRGDEDAFAGWLFTIARRRLIDHRRAHGRRPVDLVADPAKLARAAASAEHTALAEGTLADEAARRIVDLLPPEQAEVLLLRVVADLDVATVAQVTGRRPGAVRVAQHRALRRLAAALDQGEHAIGNAEEVSSDGTSRDAQAPTPPR